MRHSTLISIALATLSLVACSTVDTTGIAATSSKKPVGPDSAAVVLTEFADLQCPACKTAHALLTKPLLEKYKGSIRFEFKHFPLTNSHSHALKAAEASECAADQGKFWEYIDVVYAHQDDLAKEPYEEWASTAFRSSPHPKLKATETLDADASFTSKKVAVEQALQDASSSASFPARAGDDMISNVGVSLDADLFHRCLTSGIKKDVVMAEYAEGEKLGVRGTPSFFVNGVRVDRNTPDALEAAIQAALSRASAIPL